MGEYFVLPISFFPCLPFTASAFHSYPSSPFSFYPFPFLSPLSCSHSPSFSFPFPSHPSFPLKILIYPPLFFSSLSHNFPRFPLIISTFSLLLRFSRLLSSFPFYNPLFCFSLVPSHTFFSSLPPFFFTPSPLPIFSLPPSLLIIPLFHFLLRVSPRLFPSFSSSLFTPCLFILFCLFLFSLVSPSHRFSLYPFSSSRFHLCFPLSFLFHFFFLFSAFFCLLVLSFPFPLPLRSFS